MAKLQWTKTGEGKWTQIVARKPSPKAALARTTQAAGMVPPCKPRADLTALYADAVLILHAPALHARGPEAFAQAARHLRGLDAR